MGPAKAKLNQDLQIRQAVSDLAACWGDSEKSVLEFLAKLIFDGKLTLYAKVRIPVPGSYVKRIDPNTQEQIETAEPATIRRTIQIGAAVSEVRLRQAARDGWNAVKPVRDGEREFEFGTLLVCKDELIGALESEPKPYIYRIPPKWIGVHYAGDQPLQRHRQQEQEILRVIGELEYKANALPKREKAGAAWVKAEVRKKLNYSASVFDKAWERLRKQGDIKETP